MALSIPSYIRLSRHNVFNFRWPIPAALHPQGKLQHVETSLRTRNPRLALQMARHLAYHAENITGHLMGLSHSQIKAELQAYFSHKLAEFKARRDYSGSLPKWMEEQHSQNLKTIEAASNSGMDGRIAFEGDESIYQQIDEIIQARSLNATPDTPAYETLLREYPLAYAQYLRDILAYNDSLKDYRVSPTQNITIQAAAAGITLKQAVDDFIAERQRGEAWTDRTLKDRIAQLALLREILGENADLASVTVHKVDGVIKILHALPKNRSKNPKTKGLPLKKMLDVTGVEKLNARTINEYVTVYHSLFAWAERRGYIIKNFFEGRQIRIGKNKDRNRPSFSPDQIKTILKAMSEHAAEKSGNSFLYWGVMLAIYTGARLNEIAQFSLEDIQQEEGIWFFNITNDGDDLNKRLKNLNSKRRIPVHAALLDAGLMDYVETLRKAKHSRLFPDLAFQKGHGYGRELSRWNTRLLKSLGIKGKGLVFHSYRHSFTTALHNTDAQEGVIDALLGHAPQGTARTVYLKGYELSVLKKTLDKLSYN